MEAIFVYLFKMVNIFFFFGILSLAIAQHNIIKKLYVAHVKITYKIWLPWIISEFLSVQLDFNMGNFIFMKISSSDTFLAQIIFTIRSKL